MSYDKTMEEFLVSARELPVEFSYNEVEFLFLNPTPPPPARPWWQGGAMKFLLMPTLLISLLALLLPTQTDGTDHPLSAFPVQEETPAISVIEALPSSNQLLALERPEMEIISPEVLPPPPKAFLGPAAAPLRFLEQSKGPGLSTTPAQKPTFRARDVTLPVPLFTGSWKHWKRSNDVVELSFTITEGSSEHVYGSAATLTQAELQILKDESEVTIKRAAGSLILSGGKRKGNFEFTPNNTFRTRLNDAGMGDAIAPRDALSQKKILSPLITFMSITSSSASPERQKDILWLEYFLADIDEEYIKLLREYGYTEAELSELWRLAHNGTRRVQLSQWLSLAKDFFSHQLTITQLVSLGHPEHNLNIREQYGNPPYTYEEFKASQQALFPQLSMIQEVPMIPEVPVLPIAIFADSSTRVYGAPLIEMELPDNWGTATPGRKVESLDVTALRKLMIKGKIRLYLNDADSPRKIIVFASSAAWSALNIKQFGGRLKLTNTHPDELIDIEVSGPLLESIRTEGHTLILKQTDKEK